MNEKVPSVSVIGICLAALYAVLLALFAIFLKSDDYSIMTVSYVVMFFFMFVGAVGSAFFKEWGRKLLIALNGVMFLLLVVRFIPKIGMSNIAYVLMNLIVLLYFSQEKIKRYFYASKNIAWKSVLIVDDDEGHIKMLRPILIRNGYSVLMALNGDDGLKIAQTQEPDLVLLDVILPGIKGRDLCRLIKQNEETKNIPVIFVTAKDSPEDIAAEKEVGGEAHLTKPINPKQLIATIHTVLKSKKSKK